MHTCYHHNTIVFERNFYYRASNQLILVLLGDSLIFYNFFILYFSNFASNPSKIRFKVHTCGKHKSTSKIHIWIQFAFGPDLYLGAISFWIQPVFDAICIWTLSAFGYDMHLNHPILQSLRCQRDRKDMSIEDHYFLGLSKPNKSLKTFLPHIIISYFVAAVL